jgi:hypothetical protein
VKPPPAGDATPDLERQLRQLQREVERLRRELERRHL